VTTTVFSRLLVRLIVTWFVLTMSLPSCLSAEFYGALRWLNVPGLCVDDVVDFIEAMDKNMDGLIDYKEYMELLSQDSDENDDKAEAAVTTISVSGKDTKSTTEADQQQATKASASSLAKVAPYGAEEIREMMIKRKQNEMIRQRDERIRRQQYKENLDIRIFEEELEASKKRAGGANPLVCVDTIRSKDNSGSGSVPGPETVTEVDASFTDEASSNPSRRRLTDFKFSTNQLPLRYVVTGKSLFLPIHTGRLNVVNCPCTAAVDYLRRLLLMCAGTFAEKPVKPMRCKKNHELTQSYSYYRTWYNCVLCKKGEGDYHCPRCGIWVFACCNTCYEGFKRGQETERRDPAKHPTFLRCINSASFVLQIPTMGGANKQSSDYTVTMEVRFSKWPPKGTLQSLLRFTTPDLTQTNRIHRANIFLNETGRIVAKPVNVGGEIDAATSSKIVPNKWQEVSVVVQPTQGRVRTFINGVPCSVCTDLETEDLTLQHRIIVFGGGKQAQSRGGDIRRIAIHGAALEDAEIMNLFLKLAQENPALGQRLVRVQARYRGFHYRTSELKKRKAEHLARRVTILTKVFVEDAALLKKFVLVQALARGFIVRCANKKQREAIKAAKEKVEADKKKKEEEEAAEKERQAAAAAAAAKQAEEEAENLRKQEEEKRKQELAEKEAQSQPTKNRRNLANKRGVSIKGAGAADPLTSSSSPSTPDTRATGAGAVGAVDKAKADAIRERKEKFAALKAKRAEKEKEKELAKSSSAEALSDGKGSNPESEPNSDQALTDAADKSKLTRTEVESTVLSGHSDSVMVVRFTSDGNQLLSGSDDKSLMVWSAADPNSSSEGIVAEGGPSQVLDGYHTAGIYAVACSNDNKFVFSGSEDKTIRVWSASSDSSRYGLVCAHSVGSSEWVYSLSVNKNGTHFAAGCEDSVVRLYSLQKQVNGNTSTSSAPIPELASQLRGHTQGVRSVNFSPCGTKLVSAAADNLIKVWDVASGKEAKTLEGHTDWVFSACFFPAENDNRVLSGSFDKSVCIWDSDSGMCSQRLLGHTGAVYSVCVCGDGSLLASGSEDKLVKIWDSVTGNCLRDLVGHSHCVFSVCMSPSGDAVASGAYDKIIRLWRLPSKQHLLTTANTTN
jgi:WD40 repeat protein